MNKTSIYVRAEKRIDALRAGDRLNEELEKYGVETKKNGKSSIIQTKHFQIAFIVCGKNMDGMRCDIPVGFGSMSRMIARLKDYLELKTVKDIAEYIAEEEKV